MTNVSLIHDVDQILVMQCDEFYPCFLKNIWKLSLSIVVYACRDIMSIYKEPPPGMFVVPDPQDMTKVKWNPISTFIFIISIQDLFLYQDAFCDCY